MMLVSWKVWWHISSSGASWITKDPITVSLILRRPRSFTAPSLPLSPLPSDILCARLCSWRQSHCQFLPIRANVPHPQKCGNCGMLFKKVSNRLCKLECLPSFGVEKLFSKQFKALKTFVCGIYVLSLPMGFRKLLVFQMAPLIQAEITRPRWIWSEPNDNCDIPSSEPYGRSNKFLTEIWYISSLDRTR